MVNIKYMMKDSDKMTKESNKQDAALKLINDIALIDTELAAKIKPSIDMFIESISDNDVWEQLAEFFKLSTKEEKEKWWKKHEDLGNKIVNVHASMNKSSVALNEDKQTTKEDDKKENTAEIKDGETKTDVPIKPKEEDKKEDKKEKKDDSDSKEEKKADKEEKKSEEKKADDKKPESKKEDKKEDDKSEDKEEKPVEPKDLKLPEDGFKDNKITAPLKTDGDDKREPPKVEFPPLDPKIVDITKDQTEEVKVPNLANMKPQIETESIKNVYLAAFRNAMNKVLLEHKLVKEAVDNDKYTEFLNQCQLDWATTNIENGWNRPGVSKFVPIRKYATQLYKKFKDDFASYEDAMAVTKEWYSFMGKRTREADRIIPSNVYVELRADSNSNYTVNVFLVKTDDLNQRDADLASDLFSDFTDEFVDDKPADQIWKKVNQIKFNGEDANVWMISLQFPKGNKRGIILRRIKHDIVNQIRADYKDYYNPSSKVPPAIYSKEQFESIEVTEENVDSRKKIFDEIISSLYQKYLEKNGDKNDIQNAFRFIYSRFIGEFDMYCDRNSIDDEMYEELLDVDSLDIQDQIFNFLERSNESLNENVIEEKNSVDYKQIYKDVIKQIFFNDYYFESDGYDYNEEAAKAYIIKMIPEKLEYYCDAMDIDFIEASNALDEKEIEDLVDDFFFSIDTSDLNESNEDEPTKEAYYDEMIQEIDELLDDWIQKGHFYEKLEVNEYVFKHLEDAVKEIAYINKWDPDKILNAFSRSEIEKMIKERLPAAEEREENRQEELDKYADDVNDYIDESVEYNRDEIDDLATEFICDLRDYLDVDPWDMDVSEFIDWAWGRGNVPREDVPYIAGRWNYMRKAYDAWRPKNR